jgi:hypothetical protein
MIGIEVELKKYPHLSVPGPTKNMSNHEQFTNANESYVASFGNKGSLALPPAKKLAVGMPHSHSQLIVDP